MAVAIDKNGNVAVTGFTYVNGTQSYFTALYDGFDGHEIWPAKTYTAAGASEAKSVAFDSAGNVIVTGKASISGDYDYYTIKYSAANGAVLWAKPYDGPNQGLDEALFVAVDSSDNVIVTGASVGSGSSTDIFTRKYDSDGNVVSDIRYTSAGTVTDRPTGLAIDSAGKAIVCGVTNRGGDDDFYLAKYDLTTAVGTADWAVFPGATGQDEEAHGVAVDSADNVVVAGRRRRVGDGSHAFYAAKYDTGGNFEWQQTFTNLPTGDFKEGAQSVAVDQAGNAFVTGTSTVDGFNTTIYTAKLLAISGAIDWEARTPAPGNGDGVNGADDQAKSVAIDPAGRVIVAGTTRITTEGSDYYLAKYSNDGALLSERFFNSITDDNKDDTLNALAVDRFGNAAVTGYCKKAQGSNFQAITIKFGGTLLSTGDPIAGNGIPENARITVVGSPAVSDGGTIATRITAAAGKKRVGAIVSVGGSNGLTFPAIQGQDAVGITGAKFKSFLDPIASPGGTVAFIGKVSGVPASQSTGVWTNAYSGNGTIQLALQQGTQVPGMAAGINLQSVSSISLRGTQMLALIKVSGKAAGVTGSNSTVLLSLTGIGTAQVLYRTGDDITVNGAATTIKSLTVFTPAKGSTGHGRYHGIFRTIVRATLADKRTALLADTSGNVTTEVAFTDKDASSLVSGSTWKSFGLPAIDTTGFRYLTQGTLAGTDIDKSNDSIIGYSFNAGNFVKAARENDSAPNAGGALYASFLDPLVNSNSDVAFLATLKGSGVKASNKTGIFFGTPNLDVSLWARTGDFATDSSGADTTAKWTSFTSLALPSGGGAGPIFLGKTTGKNNVGLWAINASTGLVRKLIGNGDSLGDLTVKKFSVLQPTTGSVGVTRSFNATKSVGALVNFSDKSTGIVLIGIP